MERVLTDCGVLVGVLDYPSEVLAVIRVESGDIVTQSRNLPLVVAVIGAGSDHDRRNGRTVGAGTRCAGDVPGLGFIRIGTVKAIVP